LSEVEVKVKRRAGLFFLSLDLILNLLTPLVEFLSILLIVVGEAFDSQEGGDTMSLSSGTDCRL